MKMSNDGLAALKAREGCKLVAYLDSAKIPTIGYGSTSGVRMGMKITQAQADALLVKDLAGFEAAVNDAVSVPLKQGEFDALVSLAFNIGTGAFKKSTLVKELNKGNRYGAANQFLAWNKVTVGGKKKVLKGLDNRRKAERDQFLNAKTSGRPEPMPASNDVNPAKSANWLVALITAILSLFKRR
ncbi:lysozyme [Sinorhizobium meliloti]|uniref:lysozyme n=1 Tax=Rhizobium meliloti TaxID=382 RepID=UPI000FDBEF9D|nr:lysozyme [Sinorhizobium meliloti]RVH87732.1 lysozyme [Sinorhizobium meliloti]